MTALEGYSSWQVLAQMMMNSIQEFDGTDWEATIPWLDHIEAIAKKTGFDPLEVGMSKLKGTALCDVNAISKEGSLSWSQFHQLLIEHYSNIPCVLDAPSAYTHLMQGENEMVMQYLARDKVLLECIHHTSKLWDISGSSWDNLYLVWGLCSLHIQWQVASGQDTWWSVEDVFQMIDHVTRSEEQNRAFFKPNFEPAQSVLQVNEMSFGKATRYYPTHLISHIMVNPTKHGSVKISGTPTENQGVHSRKAKDNNTASTVMGSLPVTSVRESTRSRTASSLQRKIPEKNKRTQTWSSIARTNSKMLCRKVTLPSMRHSSPEHWRWPTL